MAETIYPSICPCRCNCPDFLERLDKNVYDIESTGTFLKTFFDIVCMEFCDIYTALQKVRNDFYLWKDNYNEAIVKGVSHGVDCFSCKTVVEIMRVGNTPYTSDYEEGIDFEVDECGIKWLDESPYYYAYYPSGGSSTGRRSRQPLTGQVYYVDYRCGVRNDKLYDVFGSMVDLYKKDYQTYPNYRHAIKALILAYIQGPTMDSMLDALSMFTDRENIYIEESFRVGWILGESILYTKEEFENPLLNTSDGTVLQFGTNDFIVDIWVSNSSTITDKPLFLDIVDRIKPAHVIVYTHFI